MMNESAGFHDSGAPSCFVKMELHLFSSVLPYGVSNGSRADISPSILGLCLEGRGVLKLKLAVLYGRVPENIEQWKGS